ncbi:hypothetical protein T265_09329 [Opisthorchis viverrini]|uniref:Major facilitator superfamily (MFS) profile domain-containing protein n=1 Tax=Opisthorchis viverrini TaxID=6198 RepID=A0A074Z6C8_OPIVI|nr:hypothetical protein T265_09329 [Opisthorchis viverrini]KER22628.1 hypothetical protein T265_09329 [Opisthorchis viverrini]
MKSKKSDELFDHMELQPSGDSHLFTNDGSTSRPTKDVPSTEQLNVDELLAGQVGACGLWQWLIIVLIVLSGPSMAFFPVFVNAVPSMRCRMEPQIENLFADLEIPFLNVSEIVGPKSGCSRYAYNWTSIESFGDLINFHTSTSDVRTESCPNGYVYESTHFQYPGSIVAEFDLVCSQTWLAPMGTSLYIFGMFLGYIVGGWLGDKYGRRPTAIGFSMLEICAGIFVSLAPNHHVYHFARTVSAFANTGRASIMRILPLEITLAKYRGYFVSTIILGVLFFHRAALAGFAYLIPNWRLLHAVAIAPCLLSFLFFCILPESPRWLNSQNKQAEAVRVLKTGMRYNRICQKRKAQSRQLELLLRRLEANETTIPETRKTGKVMSNILQHLKPSSFDRQQLKFLIIGALLMNTQSLALFGVVLYARVINDYVYIVVLVNSLTSIPGPVIASIAYRFYKYRRLPLAVCLTIACVALSIGGAYTLFCKPVTDTVLNVCCNCALVMYSATLVMLSTYLAELFPSATRTRAMGILSGIGRLGGSFSTFVNQLDAAAGHGVPVIFYACVSALQFCLLFFLADTSGEGLQDKRTVVKLPEQE